MQKQSVAMSGIAGNPVGNLCITLPLDDHFARETE